ncbi:hypothetical protein PG994_011303 [Apiospora phragmitis]|uniref:RBR-type E3 ubiquitin transferase n=1 Tax=Apiospora phragmitis TaxID=2905665 RepID=A0ABR1TSE8_9PEZI
MVHRSPAASHRYTRPPYDNRANGHASHHHQPREPPVKREDVSTLSEMKLVDLDRLRPDIKIGIPPNVSRLSKISAFLHRKYRDDVYSIADDASISFYHGGHVLRDDMIPRAIFALYYRVTRSGASRSLRLLWSERLEFHPPEVDELMDGIEAGITGNNWEARRAHTWLCQTLFIDLVAERNYVVMKGVNEEYIFHPFSCARSVGSRTLRTWLHERILTNVRHPKSSEGRRPDLEDISISLEGKPLGRHSRVSLGSTVEFQLATTAHHHFVQEEGWLVPESETCIVCSDEKRVSEFPARIAKTCGHQPATCRDCIGQWIASSMESVSWDRLKCPECSGLLSFEDVRAFADPETFERYDSLATKAALGSIRDFRWCLNPRCSAGQIHKADCPRVKCHACKASSCSHHNLPWHRGETCEAYDRRTRRRRKSDKASEKRVKEMTRSCPRCHKDVYKYSGCDHITCKSRQSRYELANITLTPYGAGVCGHEWCYLCLAEYYHDQESFLQCKHKRSCRYFQNPPNYEGGRAFMPFIRPANMAPPPPPPGFRPWGVPPRPMPHRHFGRPPTPTPPLPAQGPRVDPDPFNFPERNFAERRDQANHLHVGHAGNGEAGFMGAAAMFTMDQFLQRAR